MAAQTWTLREIARASGRTLDHVNTMAKSGLVPGYRPGRARSPARIPHEIAEDVVLVLSRGVCSHKFADLMKSDPAAASEAVEALERLVRTASESGREGASAA